MPVLPPVTRHQQQYSSRQRSWQATSGAGWHIPNLYQGRYDVRNEQSTNFAADTPNNRDNVRYHDHDHDHDHHHHRMGSRLALPRNRCSPLPFSFDPLLVRTHMPASIGWREKQSHDKKLPKIDMLCRVTLCLTALRVFCACLLRPSQNVERRLFLYIVPEPCHQITRAGCLSTSPTLLAL